MEFSKLELNRKFKLQMDSKLIYVKTSDTEGVIDDPNYSFGLILSPTTKVHNIRFQNTFKRN